MVDPRVAFAAALRERELVLARLHRLGIEAQAHFEAELARVRPKKAQKEARPALHAAASKALDFARAPLEARQRALEGDTLRVLADAAEVRPGAPQLWKRRGAGDYPTQTAGATYAKTFCELEVWQLEGYGLTAVCLPSKDIRQEWEVFVEVEGELDLQILQHRSGARTMVDTVAMCWRLGANPRVFWPMLPHGFEAQHGIDGQGNRRMGTP